MSEQGDLIRVAVTGAAGRMGREVVRALSAADDLKLVAAIDRSDAGRDAGEAAGIGPLGLPISTDLAQAIAAARPHVLVDFTVGESASENMETALRARVAPVVGTTGLSSEQMERARRLCEETGTPAFIAPNFAIGAALMMMFAEQAAAHLPDAEIIELHHEMKLDSPSGTAIMTARKIAAGRRLAPTSPPGETAQKLAGARGAELEAVRIHSVRLKGHVAHQEVIFGGLGQTLTIRHDSTDRQSFMPGVLLAVRRIRGMRGLTVGLENLLGPPSS